MGLVMAVSYTHLVDNVAKAKAKIKGIKMDSSISALGNIQCIAGYSVVIEEEQLKGVFFIKSDTHTFENNKMCIRDRSHSTFPTWDCCIDFRRYKASN